MRPPPLPAASLLLLLAAGCAAPLPVRKLEFSHTAFSSQGVVDLQRLTVDGQGRVSYGHGNATETATLSADDRDALARKLGRPDIIDAMRARKAAPCGHETPDESRGITAVLGDLPPIKVSLGGMGDPNLGSAKPDDGNPDVCRLLEETQMGIRKRYFGGR